MPPKESGARAAQAKKAIQKRHSDNFLQRILEGPPPGSSSEEEDDDMDVGEEQLNQPADDSGDSEGEGDF